MIFIFCRGGHNGSRQAVQAAVAHGEQREVVGGASAGVRAAAGLQARPKALQEEGQGQEEEQPGAVQGGVAPVSYYY